MKIWAVAFVLIGAFLVGCEKSPPAPAPSPQTKTQRVIFDVQTISCTGSDMCAAYNMINQQTCSQMSESLQGQMNDGWRVISSSSKEKVAMSGGGGVGTVTCVGTEYIIEK